MRPINGWLCRGVQSHQMNITNDSYDFRGRVLVFLLAFHVDDDLLAQRIYSWEILISECLIYYGDVTHFRQFAGVEGAPRAQGDAHGREIICADYAHCGHRQIRRRSTWLRGQPDGSGRAKARERRKTVHAHRTDSWQIPRTIEELSEKGDACCIRSVSCVRQRYRKRQQIFRFKTGINSD